MYFLKNLVPPRCRLARFVSSTSLSASFDSRPSAKGSFKLRSKKTTGLFGIRDLTSPQGFAQIKEECIHRSSQLVTEACDATNRTRLLASVFDDLSDELCRVADLAEFVRQAHPDRNMAMAAEDACITVSGIVEQLNTHLGLFHSLEDVVTNGDTRFTESAVDRHVAKLFLHDFKQCGIHLDDDARNMVVKMNDFILQIGQQFAANTHKPSRAKKRDLPSQVVNYFSTENDHVVLNGLYVDSGIDLAREVAYKLYYQFNPEQEKLLSDLVVNRHRLAQLCDYPTFAHRAMSESLAENPENLQQFFDHLSKDLKSRAQDDLDIMLNIKRRYNPMAKNIEAWDIPFYTIRAKELCLDSKFNYRISEYFSLGTCMEGLNQLYQSLFGVEIMEDSVEEGELWHPDVYKLAVKDQESGETLGHIYCDFFPREGKPYQDCHFTIRGGRQMSNGQYQNPIVVLMLNLPMPTMLKPPFLTSAMIDNLFHEMGHAMHSMLGRTKYQHVTGTRCSTDFAEVPSTLMEYFSSDPRVLSFISCHYSTEDQLSEEDAAKFCSAKRIFPALDIQSQLFYSLIDHTFHGSGLKSPAFNDLSNSLSTSTLVQELHQSHLLIPYPENTAWHHRFSHLVGYGARYYSYLMARAVAAAIWQKCFADDPFSKENGRRYLRECLSHGGGKPSRLLVSDFLGESFSQSDNLAKALINEVDLKKEATYNLMKDT